MREWAESEIFANWLDAHPDVVVFSCIAHGRKCSPKQAAQMRGEGVRPGVPDFLVVLETPAGPRLLFIELKRAKGGRPSEAQKEWIAVLGQVAGVRAHLARGAQEAKEIVLKYSYGIWS